MSVKKHYDNHLSHFYSWMTGDLAEQQHVFLRFLDRNGIRPSSTKAAIDLGAGHGIQSIPLAQAGFEVTAIDFSGQLLEELKINAASLPIEIAKDDIRNITSYKDKQPGLIICCGDTIAHLDNKSEVELFISNCAMTLVQGGRLLLSFRDYGNELKGNDRIIPVKSDDRRKLTCTLDYTADHVTVTDRLEEHTGEGWQTKESSYKKVRITTNGILKWLENCGMKIEVNEVMLGMIYIIAKK